MQHRHTEAKKCRVLFVEDEAAISLMIEDMLLDLGVEVVGPVSSLEVAEEFARTADVEAAVLDIKLSGAHSYAVADALARRGIPIIFSTGYSASALPERFRTNPLLQKPFSHQQFAEVLRSALAGAPCEVNA